jgi:hypothetical protein
MNARRWLRIGLWFLTVTNFFVGFVQLFLPRIFYDDFPLPGNSWVAMLPPYNEHLMRDVGALNLAVAVVVGAAAIWMEQRLVLVSLVSYLVFAVPHTIFHAAHLEHYTAADAIAQTITLLLTVVIPLVLLIPALRLRPTAGTPGTSPGRPAELSRP